MFAGTFRLSNPYRSLRYRVELAELLGFTVKPLFPSLHNNPRSRPLPRQKPSVPGRFAYWSAAMPSRDPP
jgi:hypothetical protein